LAEQVRLKAWRKFQRAELIEAYWVASACDPREQGHRRFAGLYAVRFQLVARKSRGAAAALSPGTIVKAGSCNKKAKWLYRTEQHFG